MSINPLITTDPEDAEWRSIRAINKFTDVIREEGKEPIIPRLELEKLTTQMQRRNGRS
jgi:hypothetical protein